LLLLLLLLLLLVVVVVVVVEIWYQILHFQRICSKTRSPIQNIP